MIIDLCTPNVDMVQVMESPILTKKIRIASTITAVRISDLDQRLTILPLFPTNDMQDHAKYPLLANLTRMYRRREMVEDEFLFG